ncbi:hypothetical protein [Alloalcanivorax marinus]|uniref:hypothetical protein n=1 Tax=Alloalcanivorax marinus TaxID=1177169 RepID=UPI001931DFFD|nr:hypothetical protein [Alloalcanivorax marinus]MBL7249640.1 hypothetical protein [Alloalcanivorax marinus]
MAEWLVVAGGSMLIMATVGLVRQAVFRGHSALLFMMPLAGWRQVQEHWDAYGVLALLRVLGVVCLATGLGLFYVQHQVLVPSVPGPVLSGAKGSAAPSFARSPEASLLMVRGEGRPLAGRLHGERLDGPRVTLINGVLSVQQGEGFLPDLSVSVLLDWDADRIEERRTLLIDPADSGAPPVHLSWTPDGGSYPETRIFHDGYRLELALAPLGEGQFSGALQLVLPDRDRSYLVGDFTAHADHLRYRDGKVDLTFDHPDTLAYVARQQLLTQYPDGAVQRIVVENVNLRRAASEGQVQARVVLRDGTVERRRMTLEEGGVGWAVVPGSMESRVLSEAGEDRPASGSVTEAPSPAREPERRLPAFTALAGYTGQSVTVIASDGEATRGLLSRVGEDRLWLRLTLGAGEAEITLREERLRAVRLADGTRLSWPRAGEDAPSPASPRAASGPATPVNDPATPDGDYAGLVGRRVTVTLADGDRRTGLLRAADDRRVTLAVPMGSGSMEYFFPLTEIDTIEEVQ